MLRVEGPDGRPLEAVTIHCDQDDAQFLADCLRDQIEQLEELAKPGAVGVIAVDFATRRLRRID